MTGLVGFMKKIALVTPLWPSLWHIFLLSSISSVSAVPVQLFGLNYNTRQGPDWDPNKCKSREQVVTDLTLLKRITNRVRILSLTDCNTGQVVLDVVKELGMQMWLGLWLSPDDNVFFSEKAALENMLATGQITESTVLGVTVGSEAIFRGDVTVAKAIDFNNQIKAVLTNAGFGNLPVSVVDIVQTYLNNPSLTAAVDVLYANIFPYWANVPLADSIPSLLFAISELQQYPEAQGKKFIFGETGWPAEGERTGIQPGSIEGQVGYFERFYCEMDLRRDYEYYYFTGIDNSWRQIQDPTNNIEGTWGFLFSDLTIKPHFENLEFQCDGDTNIYSFSEIDWTIPGTSATTPAPVMATTSAPVSTPAPITPAPITASPVVGTPAPITPAPITASPVGTPAPNTGSQGDALSSPAPVTASPVSTTPAPISSAPVTMAPIITPAPITPAPVTAAPVTSTPAPITPAPVTNTPAPITPAPVTAAPVTSTPAPITPAPVTNTPAPITPAPVTAAPVTSTPAPVDATLSGGTPAPIVEGSEACLANSVCVGLGLTGFCCPTPEGVYLGCCDNIPPPTTAFPTVSSVPTARIPSAVPSSVPSRLSTTKRPTATEAPTFRPSHSPSKPPSTAPTGRPTSSTFPSSFPTESLAPSSMPSLMPSTATPTMATPSMIPTITNSSSPTLAESLSPSSSPTEEDDKKPVTAPPSSEPMKSNPPPPPFALPALPGELTGESWATPNFVCSTLYVSIVQASILSTLLLAIM